VQIFEGFPKRYPILTDPQAVGLLCRQSDRKATGFCRVFMV
jgi:hypothetical protein